MKKIFFLILITLNLYGYEAFISAKELKNGLDDRSLVVLDVSSSYEKSHIVGAQSLDVNTLLDEDKRLISQEKLQKIFRDFGISSNSNVVIYSRGSKEDLKDAAFLAYVFILNGFEDVSILDGGYMAWVFEYDFFVTIDVPEVDVGTLTLEKNNLSVGYEGVLEDEDTLVIDARYPQRYYGISSKEDDKYVGHIAGAKNSYYYYKFLKDQTLRSEDELDLFYKDGLKLNEYKDIVIYADDPKEAAVEWYVIYKHLGYKNAKIYYNSFKEYVDRELKTERFKWK